MKDDEITQQLTQVSLAPFPVPRTSILRRKLTMASRIMDKDPRPGHGPRLLVAFEDAIHCRLLDQDEITVGRETDCGISLQSERLSRHHFAVCRTPTGWVVNDLQSKNGTRVNDELIATHRLVPGDIIQAGSLLFLFLSDHERDYA